MYDVSAQGVDERMIYVHYYYYYYYYLHRLQVIGGECRGFSSELGGMVFPQMSETVLF